MLMTESPTQTNPTETIGRPPAVWITQAVCGAFALSWLFLLVRIVLGLPNESIGLVRAVFGLLAMSLLAGLPTAAFWGLMKRKHWGRWLAILLLLLLWGYAFYSQLYPSPNAYKFNNEAQRTGGLIGMAWVHIVLATLIFRLAFAKKVIRFFQS